MLSPDVNVLVEAYRDDGSEHEISRRWLENALAGSEPIGLLDLVSSSFVRIVTNLRIYKTPAPLDEALAFIDGIRSAPNCSILTPSTRHWRIFTDLCRAARVRGNLVTDAYLAAIAIDTGSEWITFDGDFARFPGLRWRRPSV